MASDSGFSLSRDHLLGIIIGVLIGFIGGWWAAGQGARPAPAGSVPAMGGMPTQVPAAEVPPEMMRIRRELEGRLEANPNDTEALIQLGHWHYDVEDWPRAIELYEKAVPARSDDPNLLTDLGTAYRNVGAIAEAEARFKRAMEVAPDHWQSKYNLAIIYSIDQENPARALEILSELESVPEAAEAAGRLRRAIEAHSGSAAPGS